MEKLTHWGTTKDSNFLGSWDLDNGDGYGSVVLTIKEVRQGEAYDPQIKRKKTCTICFFNESGFKPMILNVTNKRALESATGTPYLEKWKDHKIKIMVQKVKGIAGEEVMALRISSIPIFEEMAKCDVCGKEIKKSFYDDVKKKYGYGVCSADCKNKIEENKNNSNIKNEKAEEN